MKVYIDLLLIINFIIDYLLLFGVSHIVKRKVSFYRLSLSSFIGGFSTLVLFIPINNMTLIILKILLSIIMLFVAFGYKNIIDTLIHYYFLSLILGGFIYVLEELFDIKIDNQIWNFIFLLLVAPIFISIYVRKRIDSTKYNRYFDVSFILDNKAYNGIGYVDSGNTLKVKNRPVIMANIDYNKDTYNVLYSTISGTHILRCINIDYMVINNKKYNNIYLGLLDNPIKISGVDYLLHSSMEE